MPHTCNGDVKIYFETYGSGTPLVLIHGYLGSSQTWRQLGYVRRLSSAFKVITIDLRGYGRSDKPHDPASYSCQLRAKDVVAVMDELGLTQTDVWGFSGGGRIVYALLSYFPNRIRKAVIGGMSPYTIPPEYDMEERIRLLGQGMTAVVNNFQEMYGILPQGIRRQLLDNDPLAIMAETSAIRDSVGFASDIMYYDSPVMLYVGENDPFLKGCRTASQVIPNCKLVVLHGLDHYQSLVKVSTVLPHVIDFLLG